MIHFISFSLSKHADLVFISHAYGQIRWDTPLPWELKKTMTIINFAESAASGSASVALGPATLRKLSIPTTSLMIAEYMKNNLDDTSINMPISMSMSMSDGLGLGLGNSTLAPNRPEMLLNDNKLLTNYDQLRNDTIEFIQNNRLSSVDETNRNSHSHGSHVTTASNMKSMINKVADKVVDNTAINVQKGIEVMKESANSLLNNVKNNVPIINSPNNNNNNNNNGNSSGSAAHNNSNSSHKTTFFDMFSSNEQPNSATNSTPTNKNLMNKMSSLFKR